MRDTRQLLWRRFRLDISCQNSIRAVQAASPKKTAWRPCNRPYPAYDAVGWLAGKRAGSGPTYVDCALTRYVLGGVAQKQPVFGPIAQRTEVRENYDSVSVQNVSRRKQRCEEAVLYAGAVGNPEVVVRGPSRARIEKRHGDAATIRPAARAFDVLA